MEAWCTARADWSCLFLCVMLRPRYCLSVRKVRVGGHGYASQHLEDFRQPNGARQRRTLFCINWHKFSKKSLSIPL
uniref:Putative secreted protein n=1 Tax=Anopheles darlingi TaxID=43151 RepID=A0A2M4DA68_ANODA